MHAIYNTGSSQQNPKIYTPRNMAVCGEELARWFGGRYQELPLEKGKITNPTANRDAGLSDSFTGMVR